MAAATAFSSGLGHRGDGVFSSVFPQPNFTTATPESTPIIGTLASPGRSFGGFNVSSTVAADKAVMVHRAWSTVTRFLSLHETNKSKQSALSQEDLQCLLLLLSKDATNPNDLLDWYTHEAGVHFRAFVLPQLNDWRDVVPVSQAQSLMSRTIVILQDAKALYLSPLKSVQATNRRDAHTNRINSFITQMERNLDIMFLHSLPSQRLQTVLINVMYEHMNTSLSQGSNSESCLKGDHCHCTMSGEGFPFAELSSVGLGGAAGERAFAHAVNKFLTGPAIERRCFEVDWNGHEAVVDKLRRWIDRHFIGFLEQALGGLKGQTSFQFSSQEKKQFDAMAITNIGRLRAASLFDYVKTWPDSLGAILDIKAYINIKENLGAGGPSDKAFVCQSFMDQIQRRFLHAGASTVEILSIYINVIHAFKALDARGVLLGKVAAPIRSYLRGRDDTASIIAASFLADVDENGHSDDEKVCADITLEVANSTLEESHDTKLLNWNDMEWMPDQIDAGPDYKSSKSNDVVAYILGLFEQDEFIKEITAVLAQLLLHSTDSEYVKETRLVELLKSRLDATKLQAAEVMLKDVRDSVSLGKRINPAAFKPDGKVTLTPKVIQEAIPEEGITLASLYSLFSDRVKRTEFLAMVKLISHRRNDLLFPKRTRLPAASVEKTEQGDRTAFRTQIVSSFFWPQLRTDEFRMPQPLEPMRAAFDQRFRNLGSQRKLHFRPALARVSLRLDLEDRTIEEKGLPGWRASVIDAFATERSDPNETSRMEVDNVEGVSAEQLGESLQMDEELVQDALAFWTSKRVLYQPCPGMYAVLERLDMDTGLAQPQEDDHHDEVSAVRSQDTLLREAAPMFQAFIANMLRNGGAKEIGGPMGITAVLRMVNPAFTYGEDETQWLLTEMESRGEVCKTGEAWAAV